jgi:large repetitive protein
MAGLLVTVARTGRAKPKSAQCVGRYEGKLAMRQLLVAFVLACSTAAIIASSAHAATLTVQQGVVVKFGKDAGLLVRDKAALNDGVVFTNRQDDSVGDAVAIADPSPESQNWAGLRYERSAHLLGSVFGSNLFLRYAGTEGSAALELRGFTGTLEALRIESSTIGLKLIDSPQVAINDAGFVANVVGIQVGSNSSVSIAGSSFSGQQQYAVLNLAENSPVRAVGNWWGNASGPKDAEGNPAGQGDPVSTNINYGQWESRARLVAPLLYLLAPSSYIDSQTTDIQVGCLNATEFRLSEQSNFAGASFLPLSQRTQFRFSDSDGAKSLYVQYRDTSGQTVSRRLSEDVVVDTRAPALDIITPAASSVIAQSVTVEVQASDTSGIAAVEFHLGTTSLGTDSSAPYSTQLDTSAIPDGDYALAAVATDKSGKASRVEIPITVARVAPPPDTTGPIVSATKLNDALLAPDAVLAMGGILSATASDRSGVSRVEFLWDGAQLGSDSSPQAGGVYSAALSLDGVANGPHLLTIRSFDSLGNSAEAAYTLQVQHLPPPAPTISQPMDGAIVGGPKVDVIGSTTAGTRVRLVVNGNAQVGDTAADSGGGFHIEAGLQAGANTISAVASDTYGDSLASTEVHVMVDPALPLAPGNLRISTQTAGRVHLTWSLSGDPKTTAYEIYRALTEFTAIGEAQKIERLPASATAYDDIPPTDGRYFYRVVAVNNLGTSSVPSNQVMAVSDKTLPFAERIEYVPHGAFDAATQIFGQGRMDLKVTVSEPLLGTPYMSLVPEGGLPIPVDLIKRDDLHYEGTVTLGMDAGAGTANTLFSARDLINNRGTDVRDGASLRIDTQGPVAKQIALSPEAPIKADAGRQVTATFNFDEPVANGRTPTVRYQLSGSGRMATTIESVVQVDASTWRASFELPADAGQVVPEQLSFGLSAEDALGNVSTRVSAVNAFQVYQGELPAVEIPLGLRGSALPAGQVKLEWQAVEGASNYQIYRQAPGETALSALSRSVEPSLIDSTPVDGTYRYAVASVRALNGQESLSGQSAVVEVRTSRTAPGAPQNLTLELTSQGVLARWQPPVGTMPASYRLYRSAAASITTVNGLTPLKQGVKTTQVVDAVPSQSEHAYAVTAVDAAGNESAVSNSFYLNFTLLPVKTIQAVQMGESLPVLTWAPNGSDAVGYDVFVGADDNRFKLTASPTTATMLSDTGFTGGERRYTVETIDANDARRARSVILPNATMQIVSGLPLKRNVMNRLNVQVSNLSATTLDAAQLMVKVASHEFRSETFSLAANATRLVPVVIGGYPDIPNPALLTVAIENAASEGELARLGWEQQVNVVDSALVVGLEAENFTRSATGKVRLTVENTSEVEVELLTARNFGRDASSELRLKLLDNDGNLLSTTPYLQATGSGVITLANGQTVARIAPGQRYVSDVFHMPVPASAPDQVRLKLEVDKLRYSSGQPEEVAIPGLGSERGVTLVETPYYGEISSIDPVVSYGTSDVVILGRAIDRASQAGVPNAPLKIAFNQEGFERLADVTTNVDGSFRYVFKPTLTDSGQYRVGAIHPDMTDRPDQGSFTVNRVGVTPNTFALKVPRNYAYKIDYRASTGTGSQLNNLRIVYLPEFQPSGALLSGIKVEPGAPINIAPKQNLSLPVSISGDNTAAEFGQLVLAVVADGSGATPLAFLQVNYQLTEAKPALYPSRDFVESGLAQGQTVIEQVVLENKGFVAASDVAVQLLEKDGNPLPSWISIASDPTLGAIGIGEKRTIDLNIAPPAGTAEGIYPLNLRFSGSNVPAADIGVLISITQSGQGSVLFRASDIYTATTDKDGNIIPGLKGARIYLQNEAVISQSYELVTDLLGEAMFQNIPAGTYRFKASAQNHQETTGRVSIKPGVVSNQSVFLEYTLISVEWSVREITIEDRYEITLNATFETDVPAPVVVLQPTSINLPKMAAGEVFQGELILTNYGLLRADDLKTIYPTSDENFKFEFLAQAPTSLAAKQRVRLPYRVIALRSFGSAEAASSASLMMSAAASTDTSTSDSKTQDSGFDGASMTMAAASGSTSTSDSGASATTTTSTTSSGTPGCFTYSNRMQQTCKYTCANGVESNNCGSAANWFYVESWGCPVGGSPVTGGSGGAGGGGWGGGSGGGYTPMPGLPLCTKGSGDCFEPKNKQSGSGEEGGQ